MREDEKKRLWEKLKNTAEKIQAEIEIFPHILQGVIATVGEDTAQGKALTDIKNELERIEIQVSEYKLEPFTRYIRIKVPSYFSLEKGGTKNYNMEEKYDVLESVISIVLTLEDFKEILVIAEMQNMPGEPSSIKNDGLAKKIFVALHDFKLALLQYADEV